MALETRTIDTTFSLIFESEIYYTLCSCVFICICVYRCMCMYGCVYMCVCVYMCICVVFVGVCMCMCVCICMVHVHMCVYVKIERGDRMREWQGVGERERSRIQNKITSSWGAPCESVSSYVHLLIMYR